jgi:DNA-binding XRE family transcriptional regulator
VTTKSWKEITTSRPDTLERRTAREIGRHEIVAEQVAFALAEIRRMRSFTQAEIAHFLEVSQPALSALEHRNDVVLSTLRAYIEALGGRLEVSAVFDDDVRVRIELAEKVP